MVVNTAPQKHGVTNPTRILDYLYDTNYTVSSVKDHTKACNNAQYYDVHISPNYNNLFSALKHYPQAHIKLHTRPIPLNAANDRRTYYHGVPIVAGVAEGKVINNDVTGKDRFKYFKKPILPYTPVLGAHVIYAKNLVNKVRETTLKSAAKAHSDSKSVSVQTIYRESFAQTDPYSPEFIVRSSVKKTPPELLALATMTFGSGLPVGLAEIQMIERARIKRAWEAELPKVIDKVTFEKRLKMMEEMELVEWKEREDEIERIQQARLHLLTKIIRTREAENSQINTERIEKIWTNKLQERERFKEKIQKKRIKALRKLAARRDAVGNTRPRRDIIEEYSNYGSKVYAPKARDGKAVKKHAPLRIEDFENYTGIEGLEAGFNANVFVADTSRPGYSNPKGSLEILELGMQEQLRACDMRLKDRRNGERANLKDKISVIGGLKFVQKVEKPPVRPATGKAAEISEEEDEREHAALILQKIIRGRVAQNMMYKGKERRLALVSELRTRRSIESSAEDAKVFKKGQHFEGIIFSEESMAELYPVDLLKKEKTDDNLIDKFLTTGEDNTAAEATDEAELLQKSSDSMITSEINMTEPEIDVELENIPGLSDEKLLEATIISEFVGKTLDFLTKELQRLREERKISAMIMLAERTRKLREAEESGRRADELEKRRISDKVFKQLVHMNQQTVESYLEDVISTSIDNTSSIQSRKKVKEYAKRINTVVEELERRRLEGFDDTDNTINDLVSSFLIPEVERQIVQNQVNNEQKKYILAAHKTLESQIAEVELSIPHQEEMEREVYLTKISPWEIRVDVDPIFQEENTEEIVQENTERLQNELFGETAVEAANDTTSHGDPELDKGSSMKDEIVQENTEGLQNELFDETAVEAANDTASHGDPELDKGSSMKDEIVQKDNTQWLQNELFDETANEASNEGDPEFDKVSSIKDAQIEGSLLTRSNENRSVEQLPSKSVPNLVKTTSSRSIVRATIIKEGATQSISSRSIGAIDRSRPGSSTILIKNSSGHSLLREVKPAKTPKKDHSTKSLFSEPGLGERPLSFTSAHSSSSKLIKNVSNQSITKRISSQSSLNELLAPLVRQQSTELSSERKQDQEISKPLSTSLQSFTSKNLEEIASIKSNASRQSSARIHQNKDSLASALVRGPSAKLSSRSSSANSMRSEKKFPS